MSEDMDKSKKPATTAAEPIMLPMLADASAALNHGADADSAHNNSQAEATSPELRADLQEIRRKLENAQGPEFWRSLDELADTEAFQAFVDEEFPRQAAPLASSLNRREFMKILGASLALAGLTSCVRPNPQEKIVPYVRAPEEIIPGKPLFYATAMTTAGYAQGVLVESHMGRPTNIEGNPDHPASLGAIDVFTQAEILNLYDPDRSQAVRQRGSLSNWEDFQDSLRATLQGLNQGEGLYILTETVTSPTLARQLEAVLSRYPNAQWHQYDPLHRDQALAGSLLAFGEVVETHYDFSQADVILSLGGDFLNSGPNKLAYTKAVSARRRVREANDGMTRMYVAESSPSATGSVADHRLPLAPSELQQFARALAQMLGVDSVSGVAPHAVPDTWLRAVVEDLRSHQGSSVVIAGDEQPPEVHALVHAINAALGNVGSTVHYWESAEARPSNHIASLRSLSSDMARGRVQALVMLGGNPAYSAPSDFNFSSMLSRVPYSVHLSQYYDETSALCTWHVPMTHALETWSDARAFNGTASIVQPLIMPFYNGHSAHEVAAVMSGEANKSSHDLVRETWQAASGLTPVAFDTFWNKSVHDGVIANTVSASKSPRLQASFAALAPLASAEGLELCFQADASVADGRYSNNGWLQELPRPFTKLTWDNVAYISPRTAERYTLSTGDMVTLEHEGRRLTMPVWVLPGQAQNTVTVHLGYGRDRAGHVGTDVGFNAYSLRNSESPWTARGVRLSPTRESHALSSTQTHHAMQGERHQIRHGTLQAFREQPHHPHFVHPEEHHSSDLYDDYAYESYAWGMVIDMNVCTGCNACVVACQSENNIPIVGKDQVAVGREMHWIRVDSYYSGDLDNPDFYYQPVACMHCEKAPCEPVCPVGATVHDHEGLNVMVYNRCVGTRYCSNNCPYKVRRFNYLQYAELQENALSMLQNPNVTVRSRGVMEKCTYCTQRIATARIQAEIEDRSIRDGEVVTACQSACPAEAIVFGDINNPESQVSKVKNSPLNYGLLTELNTFPRTSYLAKLKNPHPLLASATSHEGGH